MADESALAGVKARVDKVTIDGLKKTKDAFMVKMITNKFNHIENFQDMLLKAYNVKDSLLSLGIFNKVGISIDTIRGKSK